MLLALVAEQPRHGYELIKAIEDLAGGQYAPSPGVVYPTLSLLVDEGMIAESAADGPRKAFTVTEAGQAELATRADEAAGLRARLAELGAAQDHEAAPPVRRAIGNLFAALRAGAAAEGFDREKAHQIADILDEAARKIERL
ncbi:PadR family transcriptional regulator [Novosphingobium lentum]|uniref:PadR family transcriptional regulator n=1 Tax=Novosphingobium lentum TaxID=145287 RepID=UPI000A462C38|nr:PadR family transcriptional regulator [Novosphingobium lentum]